MISANAVITSVQHMKLLEIIVFVSPKLDMLTITARNLYGEKILIVIG